MLRQKAVAHCRHVQTEQFLSGTVSVMLPDTAEQCNSRLVRRKTTLVSKCLNKCLTSSAGQIVLKSRFDLLTRSMCLVT